MLRKLLILYAVLLLPACAEVELASHVAKQTPILASKQQTGTYKIGTPYKIAGRTYVPQEKYSFTQTGVASWYGPNFHGKKTANGEVFDKYALTAAHKTLQMPSIARVTNLENGRSIIVRINDRGPFSKGRVLDLSERAAEMLDFKNQGTAKIRIDVLEQESRQVAALAKQGQRTQGFEIALNKPKASSVVPSPKPSIQPQPITPQALATAGIYVQAGSFGNHDNAIALAHKLQSYGVATVSPTSVNGSQYYRVRFGPFSNVPEADSLVANLSRANISAPIVVVE